MCTLLVLCASGCSRLTPQERVDELNARIAVLEKEANFDKALELARKRLEIVKADPEAGPVTIATFEYDMVTLQRVVELPRDMREELARAKQLQEEFPGICAEGDYVRAAGSARTQLATNRRCLGSGHAYTGISMSNLAYVLDQQEKYVEAEVMYRESLTLLRARLGDERPVIARVLNNLAGVLVSQERTEEAEVLYREALAIGREHLGSRNPEVSRSLLNLAEIVKDPTEAEAFYLEFLGSAYGLGGRPPNDPPE